MCSEVGKTFKSAGQCPNVTLHHKMKRERRKRGVLQPFTSTKVKNPHLSCESTNFFQSSVQTEDCFSRESEPSSSFISPGIKQYVWCGCRAVSGILFPKHIILASVPRTAPRSALSTQRADCLSRRRSHLPQNSRYAD